MDQQLLARLMINISWLLIDVVEIAIDEGVFNIATEERELLLLLRRIVQMLCFM